MTGLPAGAWRLPSIRRSAVPADATHVYWRAAKLDKRAAIVGLVGRAKLDILGVELRPGAVPVLVGRETADLAPLALDIPRRQRGARGCWSQPRRYPQ